MLHDLVEQYGPALVFANVLAASLGLPVPAYYHCDLVRDDVGVRLAKRHDALSLRALRETGKTADEVLKMCRVS